MQMNHSIWSRIKWEKLFVYILFAFSFYNNSYKWAEFIELENLMIKVKTLTNYSAQKDNEPDGITFWYRIIYHHILNKAVYCSDKTVDLIEIFFIWAIKYTEFNFISDIAKQSVFKYLEMNVVTISWENILEID